jgi:hypothetical protein
VEGRRSSSISSYPGDVRSVPVYSWDQWNRWTCVLFYCGPTVTLSDLSKSLIQGTLEEIIWSKWWSPSISLLLFFHFSPKNGFPPKKKVVVSPDVRCNPVYVRHFSSTLDFILWSHRLIHKFCLFLSLSRFIINNNKTSAWRQLSYVRSTSPDNWRQSLTSKPPLVLTFWSSRDSLWHS